MFLLKRTVSCVLDCKPSPCCVQEVPLSFPLGDPLGLEGWEDVSLFPK